MIYIIFECISSANTWQGIAHVSHDTIVLNTSLYSKITKPEGLLDNPYFWNVAAVILGGIIAIFCNVITQYILERNKQKKERNIYAIDLAWSIIQGVEYGRSIKKSGFIQEKDNPAKHFVIEPGFGAKPKFGNFDIAKIGFLCSVIDNEFPSKAQEYLNMYALCHEVIENRNKIFFDRIHPALEKVAQFSGNSMEVDLNLLENEAGRINCIKIESLTNEAYKILEYLESQGQTLVNQLNGGLEKMNSRKFIFIKNKNPPRLSIKPDTEPS